ncbi:MAG: phosphoribosylanthranilate isomerase [Candidatus Gastranaerophilaceae bacterium]|jgi:phosphoribosylanthranilate isomerase
MKTKIKICGITRLEDALYAKEKGAWAIGFIFYKNSKRYIDPQKAGEISYIVNKDIEKIGVFVNCSKDEIVKISNTAKLTMIQLHGSEPPEFCREINLKTKLPVIKAFRIKAKKDLEKIKDYQNSVFAILLDSYSDKEYGGTGICFDLAILKNAQFFEMPVILAGGINPENIKTVYELIKPYAIDVSSGIETEKGIKDKEKIKKLFEIVLKS